MLNHRRSETYLRCQIRIALRWQLAPTSLLITYWGVSYKKKNREYLNNVESQISLTLDVWTSPNQFSVLGITRHWILLLKVFWLANQLITGTWLIREASATRASLTGTLTWPRITSTGVQNSVQLAASRSPTWAHSLFQRVWKYSFSKGLQWQDISYDISSI